MKFSDNLTEFRARNNLTRKQMADTLGISLSTYTNYEAGNRSPHIEMLPRIAAALNVSIDDLLGYKLEQEGIGYWQNYLADTKIRIINGNGRVSVILDGDNALKQLEIDNQTKTQSVTKADFSEENFLQFIKAIKQRASHEAEQMEKSFIETQIAAYVTGATMKDFFDSLKELESYKE